MRFIVEEAVTRNILSRDLEVLEPKVVCNLSGPATVEFTLKYLNPTAMEIDWKAYGQIIHVEETFNGVRKIIASAITEPAELDEATGDLKIKAIGFSGYAKGIPWLDNWNPVIVDPFEVVERIWDHIQSYPNGNLDVTVSPTDSGTFLLPGFGFDGTELVIEFFAYFVRAVDFRDCADEINKLARDMPFDYLEQSAWNVGRTQIDKTLALGYPKLGVQRTELAFRLGENVMSAKPKAEAEIQWVSDVITRGWFPGRVYSSTFTNADPKRFRRVIREEDAKINSRERAAIWAKRHLTRRQVPNYWETITIDAHHPSAPMGTWELGDEIFIQGYMPWIGKVEAWHRIMSYTYDANTGQCELTLKHEGAFNYDPLEFES